MNSNYIKHGDCLELMKEIPDESVDMILCDLPYGITKNKFDKRIPFEPMWEQYERIAKTNAAIVLFGQGKFFVDLVQSNKKIFRYDLVWDKVMTSGFLNSHRMPMRRHENIAVFYKRLPKFNPQFTEGSPLHSRGKKNINNVVDGKNYYAYEVLDDVRAGSTQKYPTSILSFKKAHPAVAEHPSEKPVELLKNLIMTYTDEGDLVYDGCAGSGSTCVAAIECGRRFIAHEINIENYLVAEKRISEAMKKIEV